MAASLDVASMVYDALGRIQEYSFRLFTFSFSHPYARILRFHFFVCLVPSFEQRGRRLRSLDWRCHEASSSECGEEGEAEGSVAVSIQGFAGQVLRAKLTYLGIFPCALLGPDSIQ